MKRVLLVADKAYWPLLFRLKEKDPQLNVKIVSQDEFLDLVSFRYKEDPIPFLLEQGIGYSKAKEWIRIVRTASVFTHPRLKQISALLEPFKVYDPLAKTELQRCDIVFFECQEDRELHGLCESKGLSFEDKTFEDYGFEKAFDESKETVPVLSFQNKLEQYFYLYAHIREELLANPSEANAIAIHTAEGGDAFYVSLCADLFDIPSFIRLRKPLWSDAEVSKKMLAIYQSKKFDVSEEERQKPTLKLLADLIEQYHLMNQPFSKAYANLQEIVSSKSSEEETSERGITIFDNFLLMPDAKLYVTDFQDGSFYKVYDDKSVMSDADLAQAGVNPSYVRTALDRRMKQNILRYSHIAMLSRVREHLDEKIYDSAFLEEWNSAYPSLQWNKVVKKAEMGSGVFTSKAQKMLLCHFLDKAFYTKPYQDIRSYDHGFKGIGDYQIRPNKEWSVTRLESYASCPFQYLMKELIPSVAEDKLFAHLGTLIHKVMEGAYHPDFDGDRALMEGVDACKESMRKDGQEWGDREETLLLVWKEGLRKIMVQPNLWKQSMVFAGDRPEVTVHWTLSDSKGDYRFSGRIDKLLYLGEKDNGFYYIMDYKTGAEVYDPKEVCLGKCIQLPLYAYALEHGDDGKELVSGKTFGGFGIQHIYFSTAKAALSGADHVCSLANLEKATALSGVALKAEEFFRVADQTAFTENKKQGTVECKYGGSFIKNKGLFTAKDAGSILGEKDPSYYTYQQMEEDAIRAALSAIHSIEDGAFPIAPTSSPLHKPFNDKSSSCKYCVYKDVCYHDIVHDYFDRSKEAGLHFDELRQKREA